MKYADQDDAALMRLIAQGQSDALAELYDRYHRLVFAVALAVVGDQGTAGEIMVDVFTRAWQRAGSYRAEQAKVTTWLTAVTRHHAIDVLRRQSARPEGHLVRWDEMTPPAEANDLEARVELSLQRERVRLAVAQLPADQQEVLGLAYFKGYSHQQIAEQLRQPLGTVKTRIRLAMQKLRYLLASERPPVDESEQPSPAYYKDESE